MLVRALLILSALSLVGCGIFPKEKSKDDSDSPEDHVGQTDGEGGGGSDDANGKSTPIEFRQFMLVREPAKDEADTAALFILHATRGNLEITGIKGPQYLGDAATGNLDAETLKKLFVDLSSPLPEDKKQKLLADYPGAAIVYFQHYRGSLCNSDQFKVEVTGTVDGLSPLAVYEFAGLPGKDGNCSFNSLALTTQYAEKK